jgi:hypothetical protein
MRTHITLAFLALSLPALAQQQPTSPPGAESTPAPSSVPAMSNKRAECRQKLQQQGLRGRELQDQVQLCLADARKGCLKDAIDQKITGAQRKDFVRNCMGGKG